MPHVICFLMYNSLKCHFWVPSIQHTHTYRCPGIQERYFKIGGLLSALQIALYVLWPFIQLCGLHRKPFLFYCQITPAWFILLFPSPEWNHRKVVGTNGNTTSFSWGWNFNRWILHYKPCFVILKIKVSPEFLIFVGINLFWKLCQRQKNNDHNQRTSEEELDFI